MGYLPVFVDVGNQPCVVIGACEVAEARVQALLDAGAIVTVIAREGTEQLRLLASGDKLRYLARDYKYGDLRGNTLAYVVTGDHQIADCAAREARELGILINVLDNPESSTFIAPATFKRGDLQIAISTGGSSPAMARKLRELLERQIGPEYAIRLEIMRRARQFIRSHEPDQRARARVLRLLAAVLLDCPEPFDYTMIDQALKLHLNAGMSELGLDAQMISGGAERRFSPA